jgi:hypothetical protein
MSTSNEEDDSMKRRFLFGIWFVTVRLHRYAHRLNDWAEELYYKYDDREDA